MFPSECHLAFGKVVCLELLAEHVAAVLVDDRLGKTSTGKDWLDMELLDQLSNIGYGEPLAAAALRKVCALRSCHYTSAGIWSWLNIISERRTSFSVFGSRITALAKFL